MEPIGIGINFDYFLITSILRKSVTTTSAISKMNVFVEVG